MLTDLATISWLIPEMLLLGVATLLVVGGAFRREPLLWLGVAVAGYVAAIGVLCWTEAAHWIEHEQAVLAGPLVNDALGFVLRHIALLAGLLFTLMAARQWDNRLQTETLGLLMFLTVGGMLSARANELVLVFLGLELVSIPTYVLLYVGRSDREGSEAAAKYFYLSILSSALLLYGLSFIYGSAGTTWLTAQDGLASIRSAITGSGSGFAAFGLALAIAGLGFKIAAAPFHFYAPDVYQGTSNRNAALLAVAPKIAGMAILVRLIIVGLSGIHEYAWQVALVLAALTMTVGNVCALWQTNVRRLMAYSSIAHAGYMLIGISVSAAMAGQPLPYGGAAATTFYLAVYVAASIGFFAVLSDLGEGQRAVNSLDQLAGLSSTRPGHAAAIAVFMFSLAGIPPLAGFWGKLTLFMSAISVFLQDGLGATSNWFLGLALIGVANAAIAAAYYLRVVGTMYFRPATTAHPAYRSPGRYAVLAGIGLSLVLVVGLGLRQGPLATWTSRAERGLWASGPRPLATVPPAAPAHVAQTPASPASER